MKAEDIERMWLRYRPVTPWSALSQHAKDAFAELCRACEQHGIERTWIRASHADTSDQARREFDAEIAKENEGG